MIRALLLLGAFITILAGTASFRAGGHAIEGQGALAFGFVVVAALQGGSLFARMRMPRLTGYLVVGMVCGPSVLDVLNASMAHGLGLVNGVAVGLIALTAGCEIDLKRLRPRLGSIALIGIVSLVLAMLASSGLLLALGERVSFFAGMTLRQRVVASLMLGVIFASLSPAVAIAILSETGSEGPLSEHVLGVTVLADIVIIVAFTIVHAAAQGTFGAQVNAGEAVRSLGIEVFGSVGLGVVVSLVLWLFLRYARLGGAVMFIVAICYIVAELGQRLHLDALIVTLTAGLLLQNVMRIPGERVEKEIAPASLMIYAMFFATAGANLKLGDVWRLGPLVLAMWLTRAVALAAGARLGARLGNAEPVVRKYIAAGVLPQAGVSVGLAALLQRHFPTWGGPANALVLSVITFNQLAGPILLRLALVRAGEAGRRAAAEH